MPRTSPTSAPADAGEWLTSDQVMERLLEDPALRRVASTCVLPAIRCGGEWRFRRSDLDQWINRQKRAAPEMNAVH